MSRIGKKPVPVPNNVNVVVKDNRLTVKGPKGELSRALPAQVKVALSGGQLLVTRNGDSREARSNHGLLRALAANMVRGVTEGFTRQLEINGVGYRAEVAGNKLSIAAGLSHPVEYPIPTGVTAKSEKSKSTVNQGQDAVLLTVTGIDKEVLGQFVAKIRSTRPPEPYKGKGIKYAEERLRRKVGKTGAS